MKRLFNPAFLDFVWIVLITLFAGYVFVGDMAEGQGFLWDNPFFYSLFFNHIDSIFRFGEWPWWFPGNQSGWPAHYYSALGDVACTSPIFGFFALAAWIYRILNVEPAFFGLFTAHLGFVVPGAVNLAVYFAARQLFTNRSTARFAVLLSAFSPGALLNTSDIGFIEPLAYGVFFFAAWLKFARKPADLSYWLLVLAGCCVAMNLSFPFIIYVVFFIPVSVALATFLPVNGWARVREAFTGRPAWQLGVGGGLVAICALPQLITFTQVGDLIRSTIGKERYDIKEFHQGNPLEALSISLPSFGWELDYEKFLWKLSQYGHVNWVGSNYIALLALPLTILALLYGKRWLRLSGAAMILFFSIVICMTAYNPLFKLVISVVKPFQSNWHWGDLSFRGGIYLIYIFLTCMGFELLENNHTKAVRLLPWLIALSTAHSIVIFLNLGVLNSYEYDYNFGSMVAISLLLLVLAIWLRFTVQRRLRALIMIFIFTVTFVEIPFFNNVHVRTTLETLRFKIIHRPEMMDPGVPGLWAADYDFAERILMLRPHYQFVQAKVDPRKWPRFRLFTAARSAGDSTLEQQVQTESELVNAGFEKYNSVLLAKEAESIAEFQPFLKNPNAAPVNGNLKIKAQTYNELELELTTPAESLFWIRDAYHPFWKVTVNGKPVPVARGLVNFKAFPVSKGTNEIKMKFSPPGMALSLSMAYLILIGLTALCIWYSCRPLPRPARRRA